MYDYREINKRVMLSTKYMYENIPELKDAIRHSIANQVMVSQEDSINVVNCETSKTQYIVSGKRSFGAAKDYKGKKVAVLNFANNHSVGGAPFYANAQEESLCRCSTLYPCLEAMKQQFYDKHISLFMAHKLDNMGNDDLIYTPDVVVFKTDVLADPILPTMMYQKDWYKVDVITCAAPELHRCTMPVNYEALITQRIKKVLDVAALKGAEVLILGAWGCGAFKNPVDVVARVFRTLLKNYNFETVEFALSSHDLKTNSFASALGKF